MPGCWDKYRINIRAAAQPKERDLLPTVNLPAGRWRRLKSRQRGQESKKAEEKAEREEKT